MVLRVVRRPYEGTVIASVRAGAGPGAITRASVPYLGVEARSKTAEAAGQVATASGHHRILPNSVIEIAAAYSRKIIPGDVDAATTDGSAVSLGCVVTAAANSCVAVAGGVDASASDGRTEISAGQISSSATDTAEIAAGCIRARQIAHVAAVGA